MLLTEHEGKKLFKTAVLTAQSYLLSKSQDIAATPNTLAYPVFVKAQVLHGNRALNGLVVRADNRDELEQKMKEVFGKKDNNGQPITQVLLEEAVTFDSNKQFYLALRYDTSSRTLIALFSKEGGEGMDDRGASIQKIELSMVEPLISFNPFPELTKTVEALRTVFLENDMTLLEINPLVQTPKGWIALDSKVELEDVAHFRHEEWEGYGERSALGRPLTPREKKAHQVSAMDHRGVAGESFFEFEGGTIGVMASGGGASTLAMDALLAEGLKPANYTEYSGNPTREKVAALAEVVLSIPDLKGLYVVGSNANFTDIYETLAGVIDGLLDSQYKDQKDFAILVRRGGPRWEEAFNMVEERLRDKPFRMKLFGPEFPLVKTATEMKNLIS